MRRGGMVGIDVPAIRDRDQTRIRWDVVAACPYPPSEASCEAGAMRGEVTPYHSASAGGNAADETVDSVVRAHIRRIFSKYKAQGLPNKKIAAILDVSENTMKKAL